MSGRPAALEFKHKRYRCGNRRAKTDLASLEKIDIGGDEACIGLPIADRRKNWESSCLLIMSYLPVSTAHVCNHPRYGLCWYTYPAEKFRPTLRADVTYTVQHGSQVTLCGLKGTPQRVNSQNPSSETIGALRI